MVPILESNNQIKFFAISNVERKEDLEQFQNALPKHINIIPKIESPKAIRNIEEITQSLKTEKNKTH